VGKNPTFVAAALQGNHRLTDEEAQKVGQFLDLDQDTMRSLTKFPVRADFPNMTDPFKYRLLEIIGVYGDALREMANEMFGDGIMSAIDFTIDMERVTGSQGEARCKITLNGKWLEYKTF
jgi:cyanate lyase